MESAFQSLAEHPITVGAVVLSLTSLSYVLAQWLKGSSRSKGIFAPPGPPKDFLIGNLRQFPKDHFYSKFCEWQKEYGERRRDQRSLLVWGARNEADVCPKVISSL